MGDQEREQGHTQRSVTTFVVIVGQSKKQAASAAPAAASKQDGKGFWSR